MSNVNRVDVILVHWVVGQILVRILWFLDASEEFLLVCFKILTNTNGSSSIDDLVIVFPEMDSVLVMCASKTINMVNLVCNIWLFSIENGIFWRLFDDLLQEELVGTRLLFL